MPGWVVVLLIVVALLVVLKLVGLLLRLVVELRFRQIRKQIRRRYSQGGRF